MKNKFNQDNSTLRTACYIIFDNNNVIDYVFKAKYLAKEFAYQFLIDKHWILVEKDDLEKYLIKNNIVPNIVEKRTLFPVRTFEPTMESTNKRLDRINRWYENNKPYLINCNEYEKWIFLC